MKAPVFRPWTFLLMLSEDPLVSRNIWPASPMSTQELKKSRVSSTSKVDS